MDRLKKYLRTKNNIAIAAVIVFLSITGCEKYVIPSTQIDPNETRSFGTDILPIFDKNGCTACHGGAINPDLRPANAYNSLISGGFVNVQNPSSSKLYKQLLNNPSHQPKTTVDEEKYILYWITQGALNN